MKKIIDIRPGDRILVCRSDRLGDLILALPFIQSLKARYQGNSLEVLASDYAAPVLANHPDIAHVVTVDRTRLDTDTNYRYDFLDQVKKREYRAAIVLYPDKSVSRLLYKAGIPERLGTAGRFHSLYFNRRLWHSRRGSTRHEAEYNLDFLAYFRDGKTIRLPRIFLQQHEIEAARRLLQSRGIREGFAVLHPGSGGSSHNWPPECFIELYRALKKSGMPALMTGSESEGENIAAKAVVADVEIAAITGQTDLRMLAGVVSLAAVMVSNSTGPLHLAAAAGTPVIGLYPRARSMSPVRWGPLGPGHKIIQPPSGDKGSDAMAKIAITEVHDAVIELFRQGPKVKV